MKTKFSLLFLFCILNITVFAQDAKIVSSSASEITFEYTPVYSDTSFFIKNGESCFNINISGAYVQFPSKTNEYSIPIKEIQIGVQSEFGNTLQIISQSFSSIPGRFAVNDAIYDQGNIKSSQQSQITSSLEESVVFGDYGMLRDLPVQSIKIYPIKYDAVSKTSRILTKLVFRVNVGSSNTKKEKITDIDLSPVIANWQYAQNWGVVSTKLNKVASPLAVGDWYRFETPTEGIYKIDRSFLQGLGIDVSAVDPRTIKIYSNGGYMLPEDPFAARPPGFEEVAIQVVGENDGTFDASDYILFYGRGPEFWEYKYDGINGAVKRIKNPYIKTNYYWLTYGNGNGKRMVAKASVNSSGGYNQTYTIANRSIDVDSVNIGKTGRDYYGDEITKTAGSKTYLTTLNNFVPGSTVNYRFHVANTSASLVTYRIYENNQQIFFWNISGVSEYHFGYDSYGSASYTGTLPDDRSNLKISVSTGGTDAKLMVDYIEYQFQSMLKAVNDNLILYSKDTSAAINYTVTNFTNSSIQAYDVSDYSNVIPISGANISGGQISFQLNETIHDVKKYLVINTSTYKTPVNGSQIQNSGIRSNLSGTQMIIIGNKAFKDQIERYADYRANQSPYKLTTSIFYVDDIYNEFSNGNTDPTAIRDFLKFAYDNWTVKPVYVLLFGDGTYDILNKEKMNNDFIPTYQTVESLDELNSYPTDDYYARVSGVDSIVDLAIGRLCVNNTDEATTAVDKIIKYETGLEKGLWRNTITLVADDGPQALGKDDGDLHTSQSDTLTKYIPTSFDLDKIYLAAYPTVITGLGRRKPEVNKAIINAINNGTVIFNYVGHGNPSLLAHENVFEKSVTIPQLHNQDYFFLTAATCDFGKYDDPDEQSSTEIMLNLPDAGCIAAFTAARVVISNYNAAINEQLYSNMFKAKDSENLPIRLGLAYMFAKEGRIQVNDEKFHFLGDPALRLDMPKLPVVIDSVNGKNLSASVQINALGNVKINGSVQNLDSTSSNFNGDAIVSVFDSQRQLELKEMNYTTTLQGGLIYRGRVTVSDGKFQTDFVVPKDISYENKNGKISAYIYNDENDGIGYTTNITVGGTDSTAVNDNKGPDIAIYFDNENSQNSYLVNPDFLLIVKLADNAGLNTTGTGIGHKLEGVLNGDLTNTIDFTNSFVGDLNSGGKSGSIRYNFLSMDPGDYKLVVKAWDVFNNFSSQEADFTVVSADQGIVVRDVVNYPNPFSSSTTFTFQHNIAGSINAKIKIYTIAGRLIQEIDQNDILDKFVRIDWDGRDADGNSIGNGTYLYKLTVESSDGKYKDNVLGKLAVIR